MPNFGIPPTQSALIGADKTKMSTDWINYNNNVSSQLTNNFGQFLLVPQLTDDQVSGLDSSTLGALVYNTTTNELMINKSGTFVNITTS